VCRLTGADLAELAAAAAARAGVSSGASYNVLLTTRWLLTVPRGADSDGVVGANAMGFSGTFLVRGDEELQHVRNTDPMAILTVLGKAW
jgi:sulfate adenylyltransferase (ADP) / ATP adenylyltransferase